MGNPLNAVLSAVGSYLVALSGTVLILEIIVIVVVIALIVAVIVLNQRKKNPGGKAKKEAAPTSYYADLQQPAQQPAAQQTGFAPTGPAQADPFAGFAPGTPAPGPAPAPPPPPASAAPAPPAPGTPAGWLPDPSGVPNTLRYWDGTSWTQHVAQRS